jgi:hypothetical protein
MKRPNGHFRSDLPARGGPVAVFYPLNTPHRTPMFSCDYLLDVTLYLGIRIKGIVKMQNRMTGIEEMARIILSIRKKVIHNENPILLYRGDPLTGC